MLESSLIENSSEFDGDGTVKKCKLLFLKSIKI